MGGLQAPGTIVRGTVIIRVFRGKGAAIGQQTGHDLPGGGRNIQLGPERDALPGHFRQGLTEAIVGQEAIGRIRAGEGILQSIPGDDFAELAAITKDPALGF